MEYLQNKIIIQCSNVWTCHETMGMVLPHQNLLLKVEFMYKIIYSLKWKRLVDFTKKNGLMGFTHGDFLG